MKFQTIKKNFLDQIKTNFRWKKGKETIQFDSFWAQLDKFFDKNLILSIFQLLPNNLIHGKTTIIDPSFLLPGKPFDEKSVLRAKVSPWRNHLALPSYNDCHFLRLVMGLPTSFSFNNLKNHYFNKRKTFEKLKCPCLVCREFCHDETESNYSSNCLPSFLVNSHDTSPFNFDFSSIYPLSVKHMAIAILKSFSYVVQDNKNDFKKSSRRFFSPEKTNSSTGEISKKRKISNSPKESLISFGNLPLNTLKVIFNVTSENPLRLTEKTVFEVCTEFVLGDSNLRLMSISKKSLPMCRSSNETDLNSEKISSKDEIERELQILQSALMKKIFENNEAKKCLLERISEFCEENVELRKDVENDFYVLLKNSHSERWRKIKNNFSRGMCNPKLDLEISVGKRICQVCFSYEFSTNDCLFICSLCNIAVHKFCYGIKIKLSENDWLCDRCSAFLEHKNTFEFQCVFCPVKGGALKQMVKGCFVHATCALLHSSFSVTNIISLGPIFLSKLYAQKNVLQNSFYCQICHFFVDIPGEFRCKGSSNCTQSFHPLCAWYTGLPLSFQRVENSFQLETLCSLHSPSFENMDLLSKKRKRWKKLEKQINESPLAMRQLSRRVLHLDIYPPGLCAICFENTGNRLMVCIVCRLTVHPFCYQETVVENVSSNWMCKICKQSLDRREICCRACERKGGALERTQKADQWIHIICAIWLPEIVFETLNQTLIVKPVLNMNKLKLRKRLRCEYCKMVGGACVICDECIFAFHPICGMFNKTFMKICKGGEFTQSMVILCPKHEMKLRKGGAVKLFNHKEKILSDLNKIVHLLSVAEKNK